MMKIVIHQRITFLRGPNLPIRYFRALLTTGHDNVHLQNVDLSLCFGV
jgi:hypothetical protein